jgi:hypothetical protein
VLIDSMTPRVAEPGDTVTVAGQVTNRTRVTQTGLTLQLYASASRFSAREQMDAFLADGGNSSLVPAGTFVFPVGLPPGATARWSASFGVSAAGMSQFGVYPVATQLTGLAGEVLASAQTLLPFWPGQRAAGLARPLNIAWIWPLIDQPHHQACAALTSNDMAASLGQGGRLSALLGAGMRHPGAELTWVIDPALLGDAATMTRRYQVGSRPDCTRAAREPASPAAVSWLSALRQVTSAQQAVITPYANVDMTALVHQGLTGDLSSAYSQGEAVASRVLGGTFKPSVALPAGGTADLSVLTSLAAAEHVGTVVLNSSQMRPADAAAFQQDAVASVRTGTGSTMKVLLADDTLTKVLAEGDTNSGVLPQSTEFGVRQRFLAETAMIAAEAPGSPRSVVVAPPSGWSPSQALASALLDETSSAPWLTAASLQGLAAARGTQHPVRRQSPPASKASPGELSRGYLRQVSSVGAQLGVYKSMLYQASPGYLQSLSQALAATESAAWRGRGTSQGLAMARRLATYLQDAGEKVKIITSPQVPMGGASGLVPVSIQNGLHQAIKVRVNVSVVNVPSRGSQLTVGRFANLVVVQPQQPVTVRLPVSSAPIGSTVIQLRLTSPNGTPLPVRASLTVVSTRYGRAILFLIGAAIGVLVLTSGYRAARRWLRGGGDVVSEEARPPGSVVTGTSGARHPTEAPDDLADARRWVDDA